MARGRLWAWLLGVTGVGGLAFAVAGGGGGSSSSSSSGSDGTPKDSPKGGGGWTDADAPRRIREIAAPLAAYTGQGRDLVDFLVTTAFTESRGNSRVGTDVDNNAARGWFGLRPATALAYELEPLLERGRVDLLKNERWAVALATWLVWRLRKYGDPKQVVDWLAIRRGFAFPRLVADDAEVAEVPGYAPGERSRDVRERMELGAGKAGRGNDLLFGAAFPPGTREPDVRKLLELAGVAVGEA